MILVAVGVEILIQKEVSVQKYFELKIATLEFMGNFEKNTC